MQTTKSCSYFESYFDSAVSAMIFSSGASHQVSATHANVQVNYLHSAKAVSGEGSTRSQKEKIREEGDPGDTLAKDLQVPSSSCSSRVWVPYGAIH